MKTFNQIVIILVLGVFFAPSTLFSQIRDSSKIKKNRISIQTGLFHYFFDKAPILNINHRETLLGPRKGPFNQLLINSVGLTYLRKFNKNESLSLDLMYFDQVYYKHIVEFPYTSTYNLPESKVYDRRFTTLNVNYSRIKKITNTVDFIYGGGINYRHGSESIIVVKMGHGIHLEASFKNDFGLNTFAGIDYTPIPWLTLYSKIDFMGLVYLHDKKNIERLGNYSSMPNHYPSRFDLSLRFGIGVNF